MWKMAWAYEGGNEERKEMWEVAAGLGWAERWEDSPANFSTFLSFPRFRHGPRNGLANFQRFFPFHVSASSKKEENAGKYCFFGVLFAFITALLT